MRKMIGAGALALAMLGMGVSAPLAAKEKPEAAAPAAPPEMVALQKSLHPQTGDVRIAEAKAVMHLGEDYYFLPADEAKKVLTQAWRNPPDAVEGVLGLVLQKGTTIYQNVWGAVITYKDTGHVNDKDAASQDYGKVLTDMQSGEAEENKQRKEAGYPSMNLTGWAQPPSYDQADHSLIWAREFAIEGEPQHTLNYDVRLLGRTGVLSLNMLAGINDLPEVRSAAATFGKSVTFEKGGAYTDYDSSTDKTAEYGLAGLVAGGAAVAVASKLGLFAILLKSIKLVLIGIAAIGAAVWQFIKRMMGRKDRDPI
jgi:uncharacterized membrane-anchored protein